MNSNVSAPAFLPRSESPQRFPIPYSHTVTIESPQPTLKLIAVKTPSAPIKPRFNRDSEAPYSEAPYSGAPYSGSEARYSGSEARYSGAPYSEAPYSGSESRCNKQIPIL